MSLGKALVTGSGDRLGRAMALRLAELGFDVAVHYASSSEGALDTAATIAEMDRISATVQADLTDLDQAEGLIAQASDALGGPLSVLINNASIFEYDTLETATRDSWHRHMSTNLQTPFILTQSFAAQAPTHMIDAAGEPEAQACIINMIDQRVRKLTPEFMTYTLAKMGLWAFTQTAAQALAPDIRVNAIGPGPTLQGARQTATHFAKQREATILGRGANASDITSAMDYILSSPALTGQLICVDGGQHLGWQTPDILGLD